RACWRLRSIKATPRCSFALRRERLLSYDSAVRRHCDARTVLKNRPETPNPARDQDYATALRQARATTTRKYGVPVSIWRLSAAVTGRFNGADIVLSSRPDVETRLFVFVHLFGHTVEWCTSVAARKIGLTRFGPENINAAVLQAVRNYE